MKHHTKIYGYLIIRAKPLHLSIEIVDGSIRNYGRTRELVLSAPEKYDAF